LEFTNNGGIAVGAEILTDHRKRRTGTVFAFLPANRLIIEPTKNTLPGSYGEKRSTEIENQGNDRGVTLNEL